MPILLSAADAYGGYVSPVKLIVLLVLFLAWIPLVKWVNKDAEQVPQVLIPYTEVLGLYNRIQRCLVEMIRTSVQSE